MNVSLFFNDTATTEIYTLSLHDALPILNKSSTSCRGSPVSSPSGINDSPLRRTFSTSARGTSTVWAPSYRVIDRKSTRLNSSHANISYAVFCLKKKKVFEYLHSFILHYY